MRFYFIFYDSRQTSGLWELNKVCNLNIVYENRQTFGLWELYKV